jgi:hypothetical protein
MDHEPGNLPMKLIAIYCGYRNQVNPPKQFPYHKKRGYSLPGGVRTPRPARLGKVRQGMAPGRDICLWKIRV